MVLTIYYGQLTKSETVKTVTVRAFSFKPTVKTVGYVVIFTKCTNSVKLCDKIRACLVSTLAGRLNAPFTLANPPKTCIPLFNLQPSISNLP